LIAFAAAGQLAYWIPRARLHDRSDPGKRLPN
jgi:hypothetical protein